MTDTSNNWETIYPGGDTICANGEDFPFHVRKVATDKLMMFWNGGGACWTGHMCDPANSTNDMNKGMIYRSRPTAEYGNDPRTYQGVYDLNNPENPFKDWSMIFIPYITGDVHLGNKVADYKKDDGTNFQINHKGRANSQAVLDYVQANFTELQKIFVSGSSAGGVCSPFYAAEVAHRFPEVEVIHLGDGAGGYRAPFAQTEQWEAWGTFEDLPEWFDRQRYTAKNTRFIDMYYIAAAAYPQYQISYVRHSL